MTLLTQAEGATRNADGSFNLSAEEVRAILEDNAALLAENKALRESLTLEREAAQALIAVTQDRVAMLEKENITLKMQSDKRVTVTGIVGCIIGFCIGLAF